MRRDSDPVFGIGDLKSWARPGVGLAVLGHPIRHSISPSMHNQALAAFARDDPRFAEWHYHRFDISAADLPQALEHLHSAGFRGLNLTLPHKIVAFPLATTLDPASRAAGAVNTLRWAPGGWSGFNTDGYGLATAVRESLNIDLARTPIVLLGAGGAARGAAAECLSRGCAGLWIANRTKETRDALLEALRPLAGGIPIAGLDFDGGDRPPVGTLVINATSVGLGASDPSPVDLAALPRPAGVYDMIYNPPQTALLRQAKALGIPHANGLSMLVHQGAKSLEIWTGETAGRSAPLMMEAAQAALAG